MTKFARGLLVSGFVATTFIAGTVQAATYDVSRSFSGATLAGTLDIPIGNYTIQNAGPSPFTAVDLTLTVNATPYSLVDALTGIIFGTGQFIIDATPTTLTFDTANADGGNPADLVFSDAGLGGNRYIIGYNGSPGFEIAYTDAGDTSFKFVAFPTIFGTSVPEPTILDLDIKPGGFPNSVNLKSKGVLPVAILGTEEFDVYEVDPNTLMFGDPLLIDNGGTAQSPLRSAYEDVNDDGFDDLTLKFRTAELVGNGALGPDTIEGLLTGLLLDGTPFTGMDSIRIVPPNGSNANSLQVSTVPEPSTLALTALVLLGIGWRRRKRA